MKSSSRLAVNLSTWTKCAQCSKDKSSKNSQMDILGGVLGVFPGVFKVLNFPLVIAVICEVICSSSNIF